MSESAIEKMKEGVARLERAEKEYVDLSKQYEALRGELTEEKQGLKKISKAWDSKVVHYLLRLLKAEEVYNQIRLTAKVLEVDGPEYWLEQFGSPGDCSPNSVGLAVSVDAAPATMGTQIWPLIQDELKTRRGLR